MELPLSSNKENIDINPGYQSPPIRSNISPDKVICPSDDAGKGDTLTPCGTCGRSFNQNALERHLKICEKVASKLPRKVFDFSNVRTKDLDPVPKSLSTPLTRKKSSNKPEDDFKTCPHCNRKFGLKVCSWEILKFRSYLLSLYIFQKYNLFFSAVRSSCCLVRRKIKAITGFTEEGHDCFSKTPC